MPPLSPLGLFGGQEEVHHREPDCGELRGRDGRSIQQIYTPEAPGMELSGTRSLFHIYNRGVASHVYCSGNLFDAAMCDKHMLFF